MPRFEVITGAERQRRWADVEKLSILREAFSPGGVVAAVARRYDIRVQQIYYWRKKFAEREQAPMFLPISISEDEPPASGLAAMRAGSACAAQSVLVEISLRNGRGMKVPADIERAALVSLIACVEAA